MSKRGENITGFQPMQEEPKYKELVLMCQDKCSAASFLKYEDEEEWFISFYLNYSLPSKSSFARLKDAFKPNKTSNLGIVCTQEDINKLKEFINDIS